MSLLFRLLSCSILLLALCAPAYAIEAPFLGTLDVELGSFPPLRSKTDYDVGVSTLNDPWPGETTLKTARFAGGVTGSGVIAVTDPDVSATIPSISLSMRLGTATLSNFSSAPPLASGALPMPGFIRFCVFSPGCFTSLQLDNTTNNGNTGIGIGGQLTAGRFGAMSGIRISMVNQPWTLGTVSAVNQTAGGGFTTLYRTGFIHGPASLSSSAKTPSGVLQLVSPHQIVTTGIAGNYSQLSMFSTLTFRFVWEFPEPHAILLLMAGTIGLAVLGRNRMEK